MLGQLVLFFSPMSLSEEDQSILQEIGHDGIEEFVAIVVETFLYGKLFEDGGFEC